MGVHRPAIKDRKTGKIVGARTFLEMMNEEMRRVNKKNEGYFQKILEIEKTQKTTIKAKLLRGVRYKIRQALEGEIDPLDDKGRRHGDVETELNKMLLGKSSNISEQNRRMIGQAWNVGLMVKAMQYRANIIDKEHVERLTAVKEGALKLARDAFDHNPDAFLEGLCRQRKT